VFSYYRLLKEKPYLRERERERERESVCVCVCVSACMGGSDGRNETSRRRQQRRARKRWEREGVESPYFPGVIGKERGVEEWERKIHAEKLRALKRTVTDCQ